MDNPSDVALASDSFDDVAESQHHRDCLLEDGRPSSLAEYTLPMLKGHQQKGSSITDGTKIDQCVHLEHLEKRNDLPQENDSQFTGSNVAAARSSGEENKDLKNSKGSTSPLHG